MIQQIKISRSFNNRIAFSDYHPNRSEFFSLFIHCYEDNPVVYSVLGELLELVLEYLKTPGYKEKINLQSFMNDLNWIAAGKLKSLPLNNQGISLGLLFINDNKITAIRYGRILIAKISDNKLEPIGPEWENFSVKSLDKMSLLGLMSEDKFPEIYNLELNNQEKFILLESDAEALFRQNFKLNNHCYPQDDVVFQILKCQRKESKKKKLLRIL